MPNWKKVIVSGSDAHLKTLNITNDTASSTVFSVDGLSGRLFSVTDELSGSLFAVSDISGIPSFEVFSDDIVNIGTHNSEGIIVSGSAVKFTQVADTSETKSLMIDSDGVISTRDLGSNAFNSTSYGTGTVDTSGTPVDDDFAKFTDSNTIEGRSASEVRTDLGLVIGTNVQAYDAGLAAIAGLATTDSGFIVGNGSTFVLETAGTARTSLGLGSLATLSTISNNNWSGTDLAVTNGGTGASNASGARTNLGLGSLATASEITVDEINSTTLITSAETFSDSDDTKIPTVRAIIGAGYLTSINNGNWSGTDLAVANGGTGASNASNARINLGLGSLATLSTINNGNWSGTDLAVANGGTGASNASDARSNLGLGNVENTALSTYTGEDGALDNQYITNGAGYTTNTGTTTPSNTQTFTNKSGNISQWTNDSGYITSANGGNADTVDSLHASSFIRSDANDTATGILTLSNTTDSTSVSTGAVKMSGGLAVAKAIHVGTNVSASGDVYSDSKVQGMESYISRDSYLERALTFGNLGESTTDVKALVLDSSNNTKYRTLGSNAFNSTSIPSSLSDFGEELHEGFTLSNTNVSEFNNDAGYTSNGGTVTGTGVANRIARWSSSTNISSVSDLTFDGVTLVAGSDGSTGGRVRTGDGSSSSPAFSFVGDTNTGFYCSTTDTISTSVGGYVRAVFNEPGLQVSNGSLGVNATVHSTNGVIRASNDIIAYYSSDERLKENVKPIENALDKVSKINGVTFDWIEDMEEFHPNEGNDVGVIAQEIEKVLPEVVETRDSGYKAVKYEKIVPLLIESIKDLKEEIEELKGRL